MGVSNRRCGALDFPPSASHPEYHIPEARKAGLSDQEIGEAVRLADKVRQVPAAKVLKTAMTMIEATDGVQQSHPVAAGPCCV